MPYAYVRDAANSGSIDGEGNLTMVPIARRNLLSEKLRLAIAALVMGQRHFKPGPLSAGEKQSVSIARALANDPQLVLADEPTGNLDSVNGREALELLSSIAKDQRRTVIIVSHDDRISAFADRVLWLEDGAFKDRLTGHLNHSLNASSPGLH